MKKNEQMVKADTILMDFLLEVFDYSRSKVKGFLQRGQVYVDGQSVTQFNHPLTAGQVVAISKEKIKTSKLKGLTILYEDEECLVVNKVSGLLTIQTNKQLKELTAHRQLSEYLQEKDPRARVFIVHRLDRDTSGVLVFAKNERAKHILQTHWKERVKERRYVALVEGVVKQDNAQLEDYLAESKTHRMYTTKNKSEGIYASLHYQVKYRGKNTSLLHVQLDTGRKNQIRVQLSAAGYPIVGDKKYGAKTNPIKRLGLHAETITFQHPTTEKLVSFSAPVPKSFMAT
ncbi:pseudouridine synthase [Halolactibacillus alkaliphilus]|uniref:Pseudouridine synthase n=1 Tax=Halolactibacillus alkaliphilus TaxID=442899 RepID=A0A511X2I0_9BACI|nr:RluA family pseudouridine synthase [Halolactibacillus alkaliphilus]GEN57145.1 pseudouridine synthase [Halolactibacillus alkaliphilus]GGN72172.1 pseudouridine synthase [Halolactibacillus alkaliphilus]SFO88245.1 23S rRNA pseudouridine1911/1915/1917 synthase [Halolactibacillus alkaliphilus]